jgi:hypothetical protein
MQAWQTVCTRVLDPEQPFELHQQLFAAIYSTWDEQQHGPPPVWVPDARQVAATNIARFMNRFHVSIVASGADSFVWAAELAVVPVS